MKSKRHIFMTVLDWILARISFWKMNSIRTHGTCLTCYWRFKSWWLKVYSRCFFCFLNFHSCPNFLALQQFAITFASLFWIIAEAAQSSKCQVPSPRYFHASVVGKTQHFSESWVTSFCGRHATPKRWFSWGVYLQKWKLIFENGCSLIEFLLI